MKKLYLLFLVLGAAYTNVLAQNINCSQVLRLARSQYEQGRLHEMPALMEGCLNDKSGKGFTKEERREAYRLLTLAYIYLEEPEKADESMLALLNTDHFFQINNSLDPAEFIALYNKFRHDPVYWLSLKFGVNVTQPSVSGNYYVGSHAANAGKYALSPNIQLALAFEKDILNKWLPNKLSVAPEVGYVARSFGYSNPNLALSDETSSPISSQTFEFSQSWIDLNVMVNYKLRNTQNYKSYIGIGPGVSYLLSSTVQASTVLGNGFTVTGGSVIDKTSYKQLVYSINAAIGAKLKFGDVYVLGEVRYQYGLNNIVDPAHRTNQEIAFDYQGQYNDTRLSNLSISIGVAYPYFKPKKLIK
ncbi:MAG: PorT family protein [Cyclobacteriaceae bacterium]|nr:PorT family protein [Cyclobacteriaceae bacterium]